MSELEFEFVTYGPALVEQLVKQHGISRKQFRNREADAIVQYASDMRTWRWKPNGDAIIFDSLGNLINGRKRLLACLEADAEFTTLVVRGVDPAARSRIDQQKRRTEADNTGVAGFQDHANLTAAVSAIIDISRHGLSSQKSFIHGSVAKVLQKHPEIVDLFDRVKESHFAPYFPLSDFVALVFLTATISRDASEAFLNELWLAINERATHPSTPVQHLAHGIRENRAKVERAGSMGSSSTRYAIVSYFTKAWNAWRTGTNLAPMKDQKKVKKGDAVLLHGLPEGLFAEYFLDHRDLSAPPPRIDDAVARQLNETMSVGIETFTVAQAQEILSTLNGPLPSAPPTESQRLWGGSDDRGKNRVLSMPVANAYARDMKTVDWLLTGETIKFSISGRLLDGQHRLQACIISGIPLRTVVVRNLPDDVFDTFDVAINRTYARMLADGGVEHSKLLQNTLSHLWAYKEFGLGAKPASKPRNSDLDAVRTEWDGIEHHVARAALQGYQKFALPPEHIAVAMALAELEDPSRAADFFDCLPLGGNLKKGTVRHTTRQALLGSIRLDEKGTSWPRTYLLLAGWSAFLQGDETPFKAPKSDQIAGFPAPAKYAAPYAPSRPRRALVENRQQSMDF